MIQIRKDLLVKEQNRSVKGHHKKRIDLLMKVDAAAGLEKWRKGGEKDELLTSLKKKAPNDAVLVVAPAAADD